MREAIHPRDEAAAGSAGAVERATGVDPGHRETGAEAADALECGPVWVSPREMCEVRVRGRPIRMSLQDQRMLACLLEAGGRIMSREELYERCVGAPLPAGSRAVDLHILQIRRGLGSLARYVVAVPGRGYRIDAVGLSRAR